MVSAAQSIVLGSHECPRCRGGLLLWDKHDKEPYCFNCGWRHNIPVTAEQARARLKWSTWVQFISEANNSNGIKILKQDEING